MRTPWAPKETVPPLKGSEAPFVESPMLRREFLAFAVALTAAIPGGALAAPETVERILAAAKAQIGVTRSYDPAYVRLPYPGGDVPQDRGVCTDVVIRALRAVGIDLQRLVHEDMRAHFTEYPQQWGLSRPDPNIDHRRVPNLRCYFTRRGWALPVPEDPGAWAPGDLLTCTVPPHLPHIMIVADVRSSVDPRRFQVVHNIGGGTALEDRLLEFPITGRYRVD